MCVIINKYHIYFVLKFNISVLSIYNMKMPNARYSTTESYCNNIMYERHCSTVVFNS